MLELIGIAIVFILLTIVTILLLVVAFWVIVFTLAIICGIANWIALFITYTSLKMQNEIRSLKAETVEV